MAASWAKTRLDSAKNDTIIAIPLFHKSFMSLVCPRLMLKERTQSGLRMACAVSLTHADASDFFQEGEQS